MATVISNTGVTFTMPAYDTRQTETHTFVPGLECQSCHHPITASSDDYLHAIECVTARGVICFECGWKTDRQSTGIAIG